jgi:hypothetical protein
VGREEEREKQKANLMLGVIVVSLESFHIRKTNTKHVSEAS